MKISELFFYHLARSSFLIPKSHILEVTVVSEWHNHSVYVKSNFYELTHSHINSNKLTWYPQHLSSSFRFSCSSPFNFLPLCRRFFAARLSWLPFSLCIFSPFFSSACCSFWDNLNILWYILTRLYSSEELFHVVCRLRRWMMRVFHVFTD